jgi:formyltetrahydrofolate deformylase
VPSPPPDASSSIHRLLVSCPDRPGIVAAISSFLADSGANIISSDQYSTNPEGGTFFLRMAFHLPMDAVQRDAFERRYAAVAAQFDLRWQLWDSGRPKRVALLVSRYDHALLDLLWRWRRGELEADIGLVASNWEDLRGDVEGFGVPYEHVPVTAETKSQAEARLLELLGGGRYDLVVLARYMQVLSGDFLRQLATPVINIHHSFLPAFAGAGPYERARERGVKLIGATAHYVTEELDAGPIIEQDVIRVSHRESARELARLGADIERTVLARAVQWHCQDRVLVDGTTTVVF